MSQPAQPLDIADTLTQLVEAGGSDLCLKVGNRPLIRVDGELRWLGSTAPELAPADTMEVLHSAALYAALQSGDVSMRDALHFATRPHDLKLLVGAEGHLHTSMEDVGELKAGPTQDGPAAKPPASARQRGGSVPPIAPPASAVREPVTPTSSPKGDLRRTVQLSTVSRSHAASGHRQTVTRALPSGPAWAWEAAAPPRAACAVRGGSQGQRTRASPGRG
jgi:hypothetical protein